MTVQEATQQLLFQLYHLYEQREARNIADLVMENVTEWKRIDRIMNKTVPLSPGKEALLASYMAALLEHTPVQYVLHEAWFMGMKLYVDEHVLIPRPETEELVDWIVEDLKTAQASRAKISDGVKEQYSLLDIGTGSGCIAIGIQKELPGNTIYACDVSESALAVAAKNAAAQGTSLQCLRCNFLSASERNELPAVNIIVSNPPYIPLHNRQDMADHVVKHEPHLALFVADANPLVFYEAIAAFAKTHLNPNGAIYAEIHEEYGKDVAGLFKREGFTHVEVKNDLQGKNRMIKALR